MTGRGRCRAGRWVLAAAVAVLAAGCGSGQQAPTAAPESTAAAAPDSAAPSGTAAAAGEAEGVLAPPDQATDAFTYNPALAPQGARVEADVEAGSGSTQVTLDVEGLLPNRGYAAHAHANPCGPTGDAAGPHFQNQVDPAAAPGKPSTDPAYANPQNEFWLDLTTDGEGDGESTVTVPFAFTDRAPASVVIHEAEKTSTEPGKAGTAGGRLACLNVPFR